MTPKTVQAILSAHTVAFARLPSQIMCVPCANKPPTYIALVRVTEEDLNAIALALGPEAVTCSRCEQPIDGRKEER